jgi:aminocarboxymuconate-semialdehyde decarboxylase
MKFGRRDFLRGLAAASGALMTGCAVTQTRTQPTLGRRTDGGPVIDINAHWFPAEWVNLVGIEGAANGAKIGRNEDGLMTVAVPGMTQVFRPEYTELDARLKAMDASGVDMQALSLTVPMVHWAPPAFGLRLSQVYNDALIKVYRQYPRRFVGLASLPMQAPDLALRELTRISDIPGIHGVYMATHVNGTNLDEQRFFPVYSKCEELGWPIFLDPINPVGAERMRRFYLGNFLGNPYDTGIAAASLVFGGVMDIFPRLDVVLPHAGGTFPALIGRMDHGTTVRPETRHMKRPPSSYLRRFYYDTISHHAPMMVNLIGLVGADRVVLGSDHPADMGYVRPVDWLDRALVLPAKERDLILGGNAARLFKI